MKTKIILLLSFTMVSFACKHSKNAQKSTGQETYRVIVSFGSMASGIDSKAFNEYQSFLTSFGKKVNKTITFDTVPWGREGERDYCFKLKEISKSEQKEFVKALRNLLGSNSLVYIDENTPCKHRR